VYAQYLWGVLNHAPVAFAASSMFTLYEGRPRLKNALVVGISQSGQSPDVVSVLEEGRRQGGVTLSITNAPDSPLARAAEFHINVNAGVEKAVAATKSYTAELMVVAALGATLSGRTDHVNALWQVPTAVEQALSLDEAARQIAQSHKDVQQCVVLGRGFNYCTAHEWALKLKELAYVFADPYSAADFQHGPIAIVERGFHILTIAPTGAALSGLMTLLNKLRNEHGAELLVLSDNEEALALGQTQLRLPDGLPEWLTPLVSIVPAQLYCYHLTQAKGFDPEAPRSLRKVTLTR
jgi:glutamine---fructose-6-phosphate transaminase (isomerizing)